MEKTKGRLTSKENNFYQEMDEKKGSCNCQSLLILFSILFILGSLLIYLLYRQFQAKPQINLQSSLAPKILEEKFKEILQNETSESVEIRLSEKEMNSLLSKLLEEQTELSIKNLAVQILPDKMVISGQLQKPVVIPLKVETKPVVEGREGKIRVDILKIETGPVSAPEFLAEKTSPLLGNLIAKSLEQFSSKMEIEEIKLETGFLVLKGKPTTNLKSTNRTNSIRVIRAGKIRG